MSSLHTHRKPPGATSFPDDAAAIAEFTFLRDEVKRLRKALKHRAPCLVQLLRRRGFVIFKKEPADELLVPPKAYQTDYYRMLHRYSFRLFLRDVIKHRQAFTLEQVTRYATPAITKGYLAYLLSLKLVKRSGKSYTLVKKAISSFGGTLEWYVAEVFRREFGSETVWGVKFKRPLVGGDYDVLARLDNALFYVEVKSSPPRQIYDREIAAFLDRVKDLAPAVSIFLMDTELRMQDKIVPMFEAEFQRQAAYPSPVVRLEREMFHIQDNIFIVNAKESIVQNIKKVTSRHYQKTATPTQPAIKC